MQKIILSFNESGFNAECESIKQTAELLNESVENLEKECEISLTDAQKKKFFLDQKEIQPYLDTLYPEQSVFIRETIKKKLTDSFNKVLNNKIIFEKNPNLKKITLIKGKFEINTNELDVLKEKYEKAIKTDRALKAYELHEQAFSALNKLSEMAKEKGISTTVLSFFMYDRELKLHKQNIDYDRI